MKKVLSLSLYIASKKLTQRWNPELYIKGLFTQIKAAKVILPEWDIWVYVGKNSISKEMKEEIKLSGQYSHGTTRINEQNEHREYSIRFNWVKKDAVYNRWQKYKQSDVDVAKLNSK